MRALQYNMGIWSHVYITLVHVYHDWIMFVTVVAAHPAGSLYCVVLLVFTR